MFRRPALLLSFGLLLGACGAGDEPQDSAPPPPPPAGRAETQAIRNTEAVGTGGAAIAGKVDQALDATEQRKEQTEREDEQQTQ